MALSKEMINRLKTSLSECRSYISSFGVALKINYYDKGLASQEEIEAPVYKINNEIKGVEIARNSLNRHKKIKIYAINHNKIDQVPRKSRRGY